MQLLKTLSTVLIVAALSACSSTGSRQFVPLPSEDVELTRPDLCRIYIARGSQARGSWRPVVVMEDERKIGVLGSGGYLCWERAPGSRVLRLIFEGRAIDSGDVETVASSDGVAGQVLYYQVGLGVEADDPDTFDPRDKPRLTVLTPAQGRALIAERQPAKLE